MARGVIVCLWVTGKNQARLLRESQQAFLQRINNPAWVFLKQGKAKERWERSPGNPGP